MASETLKYTPGTCFFQQDHKSQPTQTVLQVVLSTQVLCGVGEHGPLTSPHIVCWFDPDFPFYVY